MTTPTPEEKLAAEMYSYVDNRTAFVTGFRLGKAEGYARAKAEKDAAYEERNKVVSALAKLFPSGTARTSIPGWSDDWHGCVYIDLPTGQVSWHYHDSHAHLFDGLPPYSKPWDGHDTPEKYRRLRALSPTSPAPGAGERTETRADTQLAAYHHDKLEHIKRRFGASFTVGEMDAINAALAAAPDKE